MDCKTVCRALSAYYDHELPLQESMRVAEHLQRCSSCRNELAALGNSGALLKTVPRVTVSSGFNATFWEKARQAEDRPRNALEGLILRWLPLPVLGSAAIVLFLTFGILSPTLYGVTKGVSADMAALAGKTMTGSVFGPLNFARFCDHCNNMICKDCRDCRGGTCPMGGCSQ